MRVTRTITLLTISAIAGLTACSSGGTGYNDPKALAAQVRTDEDAYLAKHPYKTQFGGGAVSQVTSVNCVAQSTVGQFTCAVVATGDTKYSMSLTVAADGRSYVVNP